MGGENTGPGLRWGSFLQPLKPSSLWSSFSFHKNTVGVSTVVVDKEYNAWHSFNVWDSSPLSQVHHFCFLPRPLWHRPGSLPGRSCFLFQGNRSTLLPASVRGSSWAGNKYRLWHFTVSSLRRPHSLLQQHTFPPLLWDINGREGQEAFPFLLPILGISPSPPGREPSLLFPLPLSENASSPLLEGSGGRVILLRGGSHCFLSFHISAFWALSPSQDILLSFSLPELSSCLLTALHFSSEGSLPPSFQHCHTHTLNDGPHHFLPSSIGRKGSEGGNCLSQHWPVLFSEERLMGRGSVTREYLGGYSFSWGLNGRDSSPSPTYH